MTQNTLTETEARAQAAGLIIDHLVNALGGEPACTLRRALVLTDIDENPGTMQADILARLGGHKSTLNRDIEWLYDYGCVRRQPDPQDARRIRLYTVGYAKQNLDYALDFFDGNHENLKNFLQGFTIAFKEHKPTLRDAKIISVLGSTEKVDRREIFENLYNGPASTDNRAVNNLILNGFIERKKDG